MATNKLGWFGLSFPFRNTNRGGVATSDTQYQNPTHLEESLIQILSTKKGDRAMHPNFGSTIDFSIFDVNDEALINLLKYEIKKEIDLQEPRVSVEMDDIEITSIDNVVNVYLTYTVVDYGTSYSTNISINQ